MTAVTRRAALSTAAAIVSTAAATGAAVAKGFDNALVQFFNDPPEAPDLPARRRGDTNDTELQALGVEFRKLCSRHDAEFEQMNEADARYEAAKPRMPDTLIVTLDDIIRIGPWLGERCDDGARRFTGADIVRLRIERVPVGTRLKRSADNPKLYDMHDDRRGQQRADEVVAAWDRWATNCEEVRRSTGAAHAGDQYSKTYEELDKVTERITALRATTTAGLRVKAEVFLWSHAIELDPDDDDELSTSDLAAVSMARNLIALT